MKDREREKRDNIGEPRAGRQRDREVEEEEKRDVETITQVGTLALQVGGRYLASALNHWGGALGGDCKIGIGVFGGGDWHFPPTKLATT